MKEKASPPPLCLLFLPRWCLLLKKANAPSTSIPPCHPSLSRTYRYPIILEIPLHEVLIKYSIRCYLQVLTETRHIGFLVPVARTRSYEYVNKKEYSNIKGDYAFYKWSCWSVAPAHDRGRQFNATAAARCPRGRPPHWRPRRPWRTSPACSPDGPRQR